jgi:outer membrane protein assembly factor BamA
MGLGPSGQSEANPPVIDSVSYAGNTKLSNTLLAQGSTIKPGAHVSKELVGGEIDRIVSLYKKAGYELSISPDIQHPAAGHVAITFRIDESGKGGNSGPAAGSPSAGAGPPPSDPPPGGTPPPH